MAMSNGRVARGSLEARGVRACVSYRKLAELSTLATSRTTSNKINLYFTYLAIL